MASRVAVDGVLKSLLLVIALFHIFTPSEAFLSTTTRTKIGTRSNFAGSSPILSAANVFDLNSDESLEVVLFGVGDLRTDDHVGLQKALDFSELVASSRILPLVVLDKKTLSCLPGAVAHTVDTASMVANALEELQGSLRKLNLDLHVVMSDDEPIESILSDLLQPLTSADNDGDSTVRLHVCDLGDADNEIGYGPLLHVNNLSGSIKVKTWSCPLREEAWQTIETLPTSYPEYEKEINSIPLHPVECKKIAREGVGITMEQYNKIPTANDLSEIMRSVLSLDEQQCEVETNTGLFATHWGGLDTSTVGEISVSNLLEVYNNDCNGDDEAFAKVPMQRTRNPKSLEHSFMNWNMKGDGSKDGPDSNNLIAGELLTRFLAAPLFLGTLSPRRLWHSVKSESPFFPSPVKSLVEGGEWHKLLAAKNLRTDSSYQGEGETRYRYWRWHGFLCRFAESMIADNMKGKISESEKEGVLLVHGFGASGTQWGKLLHSLSKEYANIETQNDSESLVIEGLAPDLLGFGHSEKPPITYAGYTWEMYIGDFVKEKAIAEYKWNNYVVGGNSIGGFTAMCVGANDASTATTADTIVSGSGAGGSGKCSGVILMNPAGPIQSKEEVEQIQASAGEMPLQSVAQVTAKDALGTCKPIPRPVARAFGNGILSYLRPQIQSICKNLYPTNPEAVDETLCEAILRDSLDPGAVNVMISGSKLPPPRTYNELLAADFGQATRTADVDFMAESIFDGPVLMPQGILDPLNDAKGRADMIRTLREGITVDYIDGGHCPHDELPDDVAASISRWLEASRRERLAIVEGKMAKAGTQVSS